MSKDKEQPLPGPAEVYARLGGPERMLKLKECLRRHLLESEIMSTECELPFEPEDYEVKWLRKYAARYDWDVSASTPMRLSVSPSRGWVLFRYPDSE